jgi:hypothetical protein
MNVEDFCDSTDKLPTFRRDLLPPYSGYIWSKSVGCANPQNGSRKFLQNTGDYSHIDFAQQIALDSSNLVPLAEDRKALPV